jgi:hypothetical protein
VGWWPIENYILQMTILREGWLRKEGKIRKSWKRRYCVLIRNIDGTRKIMYYTDDLKTNLKGFVDLNQAEDISTNADNANRFEIACPNRIWKFEADTVVDRINWLSDVKNAISQEESRILPPINSDEDIFFEHTSTQDLGPEVIFGSNKIRADSGFQKTLYTPHGSNLTIKFSATPDHLSGLANVVTPPVRDYGESFDIGWAGEDYEPRNSLEDVDIPKLPAEPPMGAGKQEIIVTEHKISDTTATDSEIIRPDP